MDYLLKASAILLIFYVCYQLFLQRDTFFQANRWFLLSGLILASCIPLIVIPNYIEFTSTNTLGFSYTTSSVPTTTQEVPFDYLQLVRWTYLAGILVFFGKLCIEFLSLRKILKTSTMKSSGDFKILETTKNVTPFSFFNRIVYNPSLFKAEELSHIINHEKVHTREWHSIDTIISQFACILFWFNPIIWLYKSALQQNLEFIADQKAQYVSECEKSYQTVLLKASLKNHQLAITNNFYTSLIKKRIVMLHKSKSNKWNQLKLIAVLPLLGLFMMSFNIKDIYIEIPSEETRETENTVIPQSDDIEIVINKDTTDEQLKEIQTQLKNKGITFTYSNLKRNSNNEIININTDFESDIHSSNYNIKGDEAIKAFRFTSSNNSFSVGTIDEETNTFVYKSNDNNAKTQTKGSNVFVLENEEEDEDEDNRNPNNESDETNSTIIYRTKTWTDKNGEKISINASENGNNNIWFSKSEEPLFVIDGKIVEKSFFEDIDSDDIGSINILKGKSAEQSYGAKGKHGVVIMTKKGTENVFSKKNGDSNFEYEYIDTGGDNPLYIVDGKVISKREKFKLEPSKIMSVEVIKDDNAINRYGEQGKNGVILIKTKDSATQFFINDNDNTIIEVRDGDARTIKTEVTSVYFEDDDGETAAELVISKTSSDAFLEKQKRTLKSYGIDAKFNKVRRNKAGEITSIKISLDDNEGRKSSASWKEKVQPIPDIVMGKSKDDKLFVRAIGR